MLVYGSEADRDWELPREEAEAERELLVEMEATEIRHRYAMEPKLERSSTRELPWEPLWETELVRLEVESTKLLLVQVKPTENPRVLDETTTVLEEPAEATSCNPNGESAFAVSPNAIRINARTSKRTSGKVDMMVRCESTPFKLEGKAVTEPLKTRDDIDKGVPCSMRRGCAGRGVQTEQERETRENAG